MRSVSYVSAGGLLVTFSFGTLSRYRMASVKRASPERPSTIRSGSDFSLPNGLLMTNHRWIIDEDGYSFFDGEQAQQPALVAHVNVYGGTGISLKAQPVPTSVDAGERTLPVAGRDVDEVA